MDTPYRSLPCPKAKILVIWMWVDPKIWMVQFYRRQFEWARSTPTTWPLILPLRRRQMRRCARCAALVMPPVGCIRATVQQRSANGRCAQLKNLTGHYHVFSFCLCFVFWLKWTIWYRTSTELMSTHVLTWRHDVDLVPTAAAMELCSGAAQQLHPTGRGRAARAGATWPVAADGHEAASAQTLHAYVTASGPGCCAKVYDGLFIMLHTVFDYICVCLCVYAHTQYIYIYIYIYICIYIYINIFM